MMKITIDLYNKCRILVFYSSDTKINFLNTFCSLFYYYEANKKNRFLKFCKLQFIAETNSLSLHIPKVLRFQCLTTIQFLKSEKHKR